MPDLPSSIKEILHSGTVIPAHPLALTSERKLDEYRQRLLTQYYIASGAGGLAVGVHTTQFEIRKPEINLLDSVLRIAADEINNLGQHNTIIKIAGICGPLDQAMKEANLAFNYGYHLGLLSNGGLNTLSEKELIYRTEKIAEIIPVFGFYLQPAVGGRYLSFEFWKDFAAIPNVHAIKIAAFNRYQTLDVVRAVCESDRREKIALYTGNDDNIVADLLTPYRFNINHKQIEKRMVGGLLGHWAVWTKQAVTLLGEIKKCIAIDDTSGMADLLSKGIAITDMNAAIFDAKNNFHGCIAGIHEILRRQKILKGSWCLNPEESLSPGQQEEIDRVCNQYADFTDDRFVFEFLQGLDN